ncbi:MAG: class I SAM-dependent methyltransferase [Candidatus Thorarchaeota archaeon]
MGLSKEQWAEVMVHRKIDYQKDPASLYSSAYFRGRRKRREKNSQAGEILCRLFNLESLADFGCGLGYFLEGALRTGARVIGIDTAYDMIMRFGPETIKPFIYNRHLGKQLSLGKWDCVLCIDTAEHLLPEEESTLIDNIMNAATRLIVFHAGTSFNYWHLNPDKGRDYWRNLFLERDCEELIREEQMLSSAWKGTVSREVRKDIIVMEV